MNWKKITAIMTVTAAFAGMSLFHSESAEAAIGLPKIKITKQKNDNNTNKTPKGVSTVVAVDLIVKDFRTSAPVAGCPVYELTLHGTPYYRYSGDTCYVSLAGKQIGVTDANGHFRTQNYAGHSVRIGVLVPGSDFYSKYFTSADPLVNWHFIAQRAHPNTQRVVFEGGAL